MGRSSFRLSKKLNASVFGLFFAAFVLVTGARLSSVDDKIMFDVTKSILASGSVASSEPLSEREFFVGSWFYAPGRDGKAYGKYGLGQSVAILPLFVVGKAMLGALPAWYGDWFPPDYIPFKRPERISPEERLENSVVPAFTSLLSPLATAFSCLLLFRLAFRLGTPVLASLVLAGLYGLGTAAFPYAKFSFHHPLVSALILASFYFAVVWKHDGGSWRLVASGSCLGFAALTRYEAIASLAVFGPYIAWQSASRLGAFDGRAPGFREIIQNVRVRWFAIGLDLAPFIIPVAAFGLVVLGFNFTRFGNLMATGYFEEGFTADLWQSVVGFLFSPGRSIFLFSPPVALGLICLPALIRGWKTEGLASTALVVLYFFLYAKWSGWEGGWAWGPRYPLPVLPYLVLPLTVVLRSHAVWPKALLLALVTISLPIQFLGVITSFNDFYMERTVIQGADFWPTVYSWQESQIPGQLDLLSRGIVDVWFVHLLRAGAPRELQAIILLPLGLMLLSSWLIWRELRRMTAFMPIGGNGVKVEA